ncbi:MAG: dihydrofolate reductase family protein [Acidobacteriota bacterium]
MRKLVATVSVSLDGVMQAPGGPEEDPMAAFAFGGWAFPYWDETLDLTERGFEGKDREIVLGRKTYEIFERFWPHLPADNPNAQSMNGAKKYVASRTLKILQWENSVLLTGDVVEAVAALKTQPGNDLQIVGSGNLIQSLQAASLIDEYIVWTFPVILGRGKRLFETTVKPQALRLISTQASATGVVMSTYVSAGDLAVGSFAQAARA